MSKYLTMDWAKRLFWRKGEPLHIHDGTGGFMFATKVNIDATSQTILANGTGDIVRAANLEGVAWDGTAVSYIAGSITPGSSLNASPDAGTNQITFTCAADGKLTVARTAGSRVWSISVHIVWL